MSKAAHTAGSVRLDGQYVTNQDGATIADCGKSSLIYTAEKVANAEFVAEAFTVAHETGLTPRQLVEQNARLLAALKDCAIQIAQIRNRKLTADEQAALDAARAAIAVAKGGA